MTDTKHTKDSWGVKVGAYPNSYFIQQVVTDSEAPYNAMLMDAAPMLLKALYELLDWNDRVLDDHLKDDETVKNARMAITRATTI